jgi:Holliday junction resolvase-like predicted endonuclease
MPREAVRAATQRSTRTVLQQRGDAGEEAVAGHLLAMNWQILARNLRVGRDEIDLLAIDPGPPGQLVLVEVRWRARRDFGLAEETITWRKQRGLRRAFGRLVEIGRLPDGRVLPTLPIRIDIVAVEPGKGSESPPRFRHHRWAVNG